MAARKRKPVEAAPPDLEIRERCADAYAKVDALLASPVPPGARGGWPEVTAEDLALACEAVDALLLAKFGTDGDGDPPVEYALVDRTRHEPSHYFLVPYEHTQDADFTLILDLLATNVQLATNRLASFVRNQQHLKRVADERTKLEAAERKARKR